MIKNFKVLKRNFYSRNTVEVAKDLIGKKIVRKINNKYLVGLISETEAYTSQDPACHAFNGKTERNKSLFGPIGHAYVYISYGLHYCLNFVSREPDVSAGGVLIRAIIPIDGIEVMLKNRPVPVSILANGPGKLTQALAITKDLDGIDIATENSELFAAEGIKVEDSDIIASPRIGISCAKDNLWRFTLNNGAATKLL